MQFNTPKTSTQVLSHNKVL